ncbi:MAG: TadE family protein [Pseudomonadota bacterium]
MAEDGRKGPERRAIGPPDAGRKSEDGAGTVEFALIVPFLLLIVVAIIEMSNVYFMRSQLSEITRDATRRFAVGALEEADVRPFILERLAKTTNVAGTVDVNESEIDGVVDVNVSLSVPLAQVLMFDELIGELWSGAPSELSVSSTMIKH